MCCGRTRMQTPLLEISPGKKRSDNSTGLTIGTIRTEQDVISSLNYYILYHAALLSLTIILHHV